MSLEAVGQEGIPIRSLPLPWVRFVWQTIEIPNVSEATSSELIRPATKDEAQKVIEVILNSLSMDSVWNDAFAKVELYLKEAVTRLFSKDSPLCLVIPKGNRFIAASLLDPQAETSAQLLSGPVVLSEYRNRGLGSQLLHASLVTLRDQGLHEVRGVTRAGTAAARHVYPKFGGIGESIQQPCFSLSPQQAVVGQFEISGSKKS